MCSQGQSNFTALNSLALFYALTGAEAALQEAENALPGYEPKGQPALSISSVSSRLKSRYGTTRPRYATEGLGGPTPTPSALGHSNGGSRSASAPPFPTGIPSSPGSPSFQPTFNPLGRNGAFQTNGKAARGGRYGLAVRGTSTPPPSTQTTSQPKSSCSPVSSRPPTPPPFTQGGTATQDNIGFSGGGLGLGIVTEEAPEQNGKYTVEEEL
jgi:hypothetical protein